MTCRRDAKRGWSRRLVLTAFVFSLSAVVTGCLSPTLPLPPPSKPTISSPDDNGNIRISGVVQSRATVFAHNLRTDQIVGQVTEDDGRYDMTMEADAGDRINVWQTVNTEKSAATEAVVPETSAVDSNTVPSPAMGGSSSDE